ncbi:hypothetical protein [Nocardioides albus]|uniref:Uncharacterized protein n=1 Tax=Nocardioides albus TaxID=1841 RepID=A0A7W5FAX2_9ACTN|nr:hypothetical protein [Nocardioides albus]MBB3091615.1 hypothetical protein [Nocardioides albus]GGU45098.1 hypothetical protein GCM10007979_50350 [Nocardioides albus]
MNTFEQSLLTELREHVATRTPGPARGPVRSTLARRWRWAAVPAATAAAVTAVLLAVSGPTPAYAVDDSGDDVVVTVYRLDDAKGLEQALREHGLAAEIDYAPAASQTVDGGSLDSAAGSEQGIKLREKSSADRPDGSAPKIETALSEDAFTLRLDREAIPENQVLHLTTTGSVDDGLAGLRISWLPA